MILEQRKPLPVPSHSYRGVVMWSADLWRGITVRSSVCSVPHCQRIVPESADSETADTGFDYNQWR